VLFEFFQRPDEIHDAGDAEVLGGSGRSLQRGRAERGGAALREQNAVDTGPVGDAKQCAKILRVLNAVKSQNETRGRRAGWIRLEKVFKREEFLGPDKSNDALMAGISGDGSQLLARLLGDPDSALAAGGDNGFKARVVALTGHKHLVEVASSGAQSFLHRMQAVENFHEGSVEDL
jgi:hypothetical protein